MSKYYKYLSITFLIIILWCIYVFFDYYLDRSFLPGLTLFFDYLFSAIFLVGISLLLFALRFTKYKSSVKNSFIYVFAAFSGMFLSSAYFLYLILSNNVQEFFSSLEYINLLVYLLLFFGVYFIVDLCRTIYKNPSLLNKSIKLRQDIADNYVIALQILYSLLVDSGNSHWAQWIKKDIYFWENQNSVTHHLKAFGGMGSINDIYLENADIAGVWRNNLFDITKAFSWSIAKRKISSPTESFYNKDPQDISGWRCLICNHAIIPTLSIEQYLAATLLPKLFVEYAIENRLIEILELERNIMLDSVVKRRERIKGLIQANNITLSMNKDWLKVCTKCGGNVRIYRWTLEDNDTKLIASDSNLKSRT